MHAKFTYFDFMMYVLPGAILEVCILGAAGLAGIAPPDALAIGSLLETVVFMLGAFVLGQFVQVIAHTVPEWALKRIFWKGFFPSEIALFAGAKLFSSTERRMII